MANKHTVSRVYKSEGGSVTISSKEVSIGQSINIEETIAVDATDVAVAFAVDVADIKAIGFGCSRAAGAGAGTVALKIETNSTTVPDDTFDVTDKNGVGWAEGDPVALPVTEDITIIYVTNTGEVAANLIIRAGIDPTP